MGSWMKALDRILRGETTRVSALRRGMIEEPIGGLSLLIALLGVFYGACMGCFALFKHGGPSYLQLLASALKVPALFFLTLGVTFPSLYVFNALVGSRLTAQSVLRLLIASLGVILAVLASFGPIVSFFSLSTTSYPFMVLLNVAGFAVAGVLGLVFLLRTLQRLSIAQTERFQPPPASAVAPGGEAAVELLPDEAAGALDRTEDHLLGRHVRTVFRCWVVLFGLVGAQMSWVLRPFLGNPNQPFTWFRPRESHFFQAVIDALRNLFS